MAMTDDPAKKPREPAPTTPARATTPTSAPSWLLALYLGGLVLVYMGERVLSGLEKGAGFITALGVLGVLVVDAPALRPTLSLGRRTRRDRADARRALGGGCRGARALRAHHRPRHGPLGHRADGGARTHEGPRPAHGRLDRADRDLDAADDLRRDGAASDALRRASREPSRSRRRRSGPDARCRCGLRHALRVRRVRRRSQRRFLVLQDLAAERIDQAHRRVGERSDPGRRVLPAGERGEERGRALPERPPAVGAEAPHRDPGSPGRAEDARGSCASPRTA